jgi:hypothetical protein
LSTLIQLPGRQPAGATIGKPPPEPSPDHDPAITNLRVAEQHISNGLSDHGHWLGHATLRQAHGHLPAKRVQQDGWWNPVHGRLLSEVRQPLDPQPLPQWFWEKLFVERGMPFLGGVQSEQNHQDQEAN